jgi:hypothetical protein
VLSSHLAGSPPPAVSALSSLSWNPRERTSRHPRVFQALSTGSIPVARFDSDPDTLKANGAWRSLVAHSAGGRKVAGSNPVAPTEQNRRFPAVLCI